MRLTEHMVPLPLLPALLTVATAGAVCAPRHAAWRVSLPLAGILPDPKDYATIGWLIVGLFALVKIADGVLDFYKKHVKTSDGVYATAAALAAHQTHVEQRLKEQQAYHHEEIHRLAQDLANFSTDARNGRESVQNRLNTQVELLFHLRGQVEGILVSTKATVEAAERTAERAEKAAERADQAVDAAKRVADARS